MACESSCENVDIAINRCKATVIYLPVSSQTIIEALTILQNYSSGVSGAKQLEKELNSKTLKSPF